MQFFDGDGFEQGGQGIRTRRYSLRGRRSSGREEAPRTCAERGGEAEGYRGPHIGTCLLGYGDRDRGTLFGASNRRVAELIAEKAYTEVNHDKGRGRLRHVERRLQEFDALRAAYEGTQERSGGRTREHRRARCSNVLLAENNARALRGENGRALRAQLSVLNLLNSGIL